MSKSDGLENSWLLLYFTATAIANIADNAASVPATNIFISLHTADPGEGGNQTSNECAYTGYARIAVVRTSGGWTVSGTNPTQAVNAALVQFAKSTGVADNTNAIYFGVGRSSSGAGTLDYSGVLGTALGPGTAETDDNTVTIPGLAGVAVGDKIIFVHSPNGLTPGGIVEGTTYFAKTVAGDVLTLSATSGGATLTVTSDGSGFWYRSSPLQITLNVQPQFAAGTLVVTED
jgi:hypothetical protein